MRESEIERDHGGREMWAEFLSLIVEANERIEMGYFWNFVVVVLFWLLSFQDILSVYSLTTTVSIQFSDLIIYGLIAYIFNDTKCLCAHTHTLNFNRFSNYFDYTV